MVFHPSLNKIQADRLIRTKRRTISLEITSDARLLIRAPLFASKKTIEQMIAKHKRWIVRKQSFIREKSLLRQPKKFEEGETFLYQGKPYALRFVEEQGCVLKLEDGFLFLRTRRVSAKDHFIEWYRKEALQKIAERIRHFALLWKLTPKAVRLSRARKRWGSCSGEGRLSFNWRLILAPPEILDYVVVHELAHLTIKNHSRRFWDRVAEMLPEYRKSRVWLRENEPLLHF